MLLDEIRILARKHKEQIYGDSSKPQKEREYVDMIEKLYSNEDYVKEAPKSLVLQTLFSVGYDVKQVNDIYKELMAEITNTYSVVSPEQLSRIMETNENYDHGSK